MGETDTISRQMAIDTIMGQPPEPHYPSWYAAQIEKLPAVQPATNCSEIPNGSDDTISRQVVTKFLNDWLSCLFENCHKQSASDLKMIIKDFKNLPSVQPEQNGKWIYNSPTTMKCDRCGFAIKDWDWHRFKFCPNCGARMKGGGAE